MNLSYLPISIRLLLPSSSRLQPNSWRCFGTRSPKLSNLGSSLVSKTSVQGLHNPQSKPNDFWLQIRSLTARSWSAILVTRGGLEREWPGAKHLRDLAFSKHRNAL